MSATFTNNAAAAADSIVLTFSERLFSFSLTAANFLFIVNGVNCSGVVSVDEILTNTNTGQPVGTAGSTPIIDPFTPGDTIVTLVVAVAAAGGPCDLSTMVTGDRIALGPPALVGNAGVVQLATGEADTSGNTLNNLNDTAIYIGPPSPVAAATTGSFSVITSQ
jgi:hypothetical protein